MQVLGLNKRKIKEKRAIFVLAVPGNSLVEEGIRSITAYSRKVDADVIIRRQQIYSTRDRFGIDLGGGKSHPIMERLAILDYFKIYDRILSLDTDILITKHAPNIFEVYPDYDRLYWMKESIYEPDTKHSVDEVQRILGQIKWKTTNGQPDYYNAGIFLCSRQSSIAFQKMANNMVTWQVNMQFCPWWEQTWANYLCQQHHLPVQAIDEKFNYIVGMEKWKAPENWLKNRFNAYFIHYTGCGQYKVMIKEDFNREEILN